MNKYKSISYLATLPSSVEVKNSQDRQLETCYSDSTFAFVFLVNTGLTSCFFFPSLTSCLRLIENFDKVLLGFVYIVCCNLINS